MKTISDYLWDDKEEMPRWLSDYRKGETVNLRKAFKTSRLVFYPGAGSDFTVLDGFNPSETAHIYVFADYRAHDYRDAFHKITASHENFCPGYHLLHSYRRRMDKNIQAWCLQEREKREKTGYQSDEGLEVRCDIFIMEKDADNPVPGVERFMLVYLQMDAICAYRLLFNNTKVKFYGMLLQDHGFGGNYTTFGNKGLLYETAREIGAFPRYIYSRMKDDMWYEYQAVRGVSPIYTICGDYRYLYEKSDDRPAAVRNYAVI